MHGTDIAALTGNRRKCNQTWLRGLLSHLESNLSLPIPSIDSIIDIDEQTCFLEIIGIYNEDALGEKKRNVDVHDSHQQIDDSTTTKQDSKPSDYQAEW
jgi:hypothetical protein